MAIPKAGLDIVLQGEAEYRKAIQAINADTKVLTSEMQKLKAEYEGNETSTEALRAKSENLERQLLQQKDKIKLLRSAVKNAASEYGEADKRTSSWKTQLNNAEAAEIKLKKELDATNEALQESESAMDDAGDATDDASDALEDYTEKAEGASNETGIFAGVLKADLVRDAIHAAIDGLKKIGEAAFDFGKRVVDAYGELEQAVGGSESVFQEYAEVVREASESAYQSMGSSQAEYLAAATQMGALLQGSGLDIQRSAELTVEVMQRAADVASVMGIDVTAAFDAVTGAAKGNFTMMDNLGVKMDATTLAAYALEKGFSKAYDEMSETEKVELAMQYFLDRTAQYAGNFEQEAVSTVAGSIDTLKASYQNWLAGLGDANADVSSLTYQMVDSFDAAAANVLDIVETVISQVPEVYDGVMRALDEKNPELAAKIHETVEPLKSIYDSCKRIWDLGTEIFGKLPGWTEDLVPFLRKIGVLPPSLQQIADDFKNLVTALELGWDAIVSGLEWVESKAQEAYAWIQNVLNNAGAAMADYDYDWGVGGSADYGYNAAGDSSWRGGMTWVGEGGAELVDLPRGSRIFDAQESQMIAQGFATDTSRIEADTGRIERLLEMIYAEFSALRVKERMA